MGHPGTFTQKESYDLRLAEKYMRHEFFVSSHPTLAVMVLTNVVRILRIFGIANLIALRFLAICISATTVIVWQTACSYFLSEKKSLLFALLFVFDSALHVTDRLFCSDTLLRLFFALFLNSFVRQSLFSCGIYFSFLISSTNFYMYLLIPILIFIAIKSYLLVINKNVTLLYSTKSWFCQTLYMIICLILIPLLSRNLTCLLHVFIANEHSTAALKFSARFQSSLKNHHYEESDRYLMDRSFVTITSIPHGFFVKSGTKITTESKQHSVYGDSEKDVDAVWQVVKMHINENLKNETQTQSFANNESENLNNGTHKDDLISNDVNSTQRNTEIEENAPNNDSEDIKKCEMNRQNTSKNIQKPEDAPSGIFYQNNSTHEKDTLKISENKSKKEAINQKKVGQNNSNWSPGTLIDSINSHEEPQKKSIDNHEENSIKDSHPKLNYGHNKDNQDIRDEHKNFYSASSKGDLKATNEQKNLTVKNSQTDANSARVGSNYNKNAHPANEITISKDSAQPRKGQDNIKFLFETDPDALNKQLNLQNKYFLYSGDFVKLVHAATARHLHSHNVRLRPGGAEARMQELTSYGNAATGVTDDNDLWKIVCDTPEVQARVSSCTLLHVRTGAKIGMKGGSADGEMYAGGEGRRAHAYFSFEDNRVDPAFAAVASDLRTAEKIPAYPILSLSAMTSEYRQRVAEIPPEPTTEKIGPLQWLKMRKPVLLAVSTAENRGSFVVLAGNAVNWSICYIAIIFPILCLINGALSARKWPAMIIEPSAYIVFGGFFFTILPFFFTPAATLDTFMFAYPAGLLCGFVILGKFRLSFLIIVVTISSIAFYYRLPLCGKSVGYAECIRAGGQQLCSSLKT